MRSTTTRTTKVILGLVVLAVVAVVGGTWTYINVIKDDAPERLTLTEDPAASDASDPRGDTAGGLEGTWMATDGSQAGYRVKEVLFGQDTEGVGRTSDVTGTVTVEGTTVTVAEFEVDMTTITSDAERRDGQFHGRLMDTAQFPTATFVLTQPIELGPEAAAGEVVSATAVGELTLRGQTKPVEIDLEARQSRDTFEVAGSLPIVFADWGIPNPSNVAATVGDEGEMELLLILVKR